MTVYEQQARALKEIAHELKGIRRALDIISKSMKTDDDQVETIADMVARSKENQEAEQEEKLFCNWTGRECIMCVPHDCSHRFKGGGKNV